MRVPIRMSPESLFDFLASTRLPLVSSLSTIVGWLSLGLALATAVFGTACLFVDGGLWTAALPWSGALPSLVAAPIFFVAWRHWRAAALPRAASWLFAALFTLAMLANLPCGGFSPAAYLHPVLALLATVGLGVVPGLTWTLVAVTVLLLGAMVRPGEGVPAAVLPELWLHVTSLAAITLASALAGAITNRLLGMALLTAEAQRRKNVESSRALRHREKLLRHALRVETIGDLAGMVCHQLRNSFQVLMGHAALGAMGDEAERGRRLQLIESALAEARPLLDQLMSLAHPDEGASEACDVAACLRQFEAQARPVLPQAVQLRAEIPERLPPVLLNPRGLVHALWNLVINARQAIEGEGLITLRCGADGHQVWLEVQDTGVGMPPEVRARIFEPYFTTKPPGQGTGLGLTAVDRFVRGSNGLVQVDSEVGRGTTFRLRFPQLQSAAQTRSA
ncbi:MAG: HAMP domain-containing histidine kinase [Planctomycetes bacterium]|nr:HAMP domain-containing histidine kinase [Planctomycetota bacterium]